MEERKIIKNSRVESVHNVIMEGRKKISVSGVDDVESFNDEEIVLHTNMGIMVIEGEMLHINKLSIDNGEVLIDGEIESLKYEDDRSGSRGSLLSRLFK